MLTKGDRFVCLMRDGLARIVAYDREREKGAPFALYFTLARLCYVERTDTIKTTANEVRRAMGRTKQHRQYTQLLDVLRDTGLVVTDHHAAQGMTYHLPDMTELWR